MLVAVQMRAEDNAVLMNFCQIAEAESLETAGSGEDGPVPVHEAVQATEAIDGLVAGAQIQVIGVSEDDLSVQIFG